MTTMRHDHTGLGRLVSIPGLVLLALSACQPGEQDDGLETTTEGSTTTMEGSSTDVPSTSADTTDGSTTEGSTTSQADGDSSTTEAGLSCGDGVAESIEDCDGADLRGATCESLGFSGGTLACDAGCAYDSEGCTVLPPDAPTLMLGFSAIKQFDFSWGAVPYAEYYQLEESAAPGEPFVQIGEDIVGESISVTMPLHLRHQASYRLRACNAAACTESAAVAVMGSLVEAIGYVKGSNTDVADYFGHSVALSGDGNTLAVGALGEESDADGIDDDQADESVPFAGAVYVFTRDDMGVWTQQAYVKASNSDSGDQFGHSVALSYDGDTLAVGARIESSAATGINGNELDNNGFGSGAVYVFARVGMEWSQEAYVKASNNGLSDEFGWSVALSSDGDTLAVGAYWEDGGATGIDGNQANEGAQLSGAVYVFVRDGMGAWSQQAYVKASNTGMNDRFGGDLALSGDGNTLAVGAFWEDGGSTGINGNQADESASNSGAVYVFVRDGMGAWSQQAYVKASNTGMDDRFGWSVALSADGDTLAVGASGEASNATGVGGDQSDDSVDDAGAVYVFVRDGLGAWSQQAYVKASNTGVDDLFGWRVALDADGNTLAASARDESSAAVGIGGEQGDEAFESGAVYVLVRDAMGVWSHHAFVKASNTGVEDQFGLDVALSEDARTLAVGAHQEQSSATGIGGDPTDDSAYRAGAVYLY